MGKNSAVGKLMRSINVFRIELKWAVFVCNPPITPYLLHFILCWNWGAAISVAFTSVANCIFQRWLQPHIIFLTTHHVQQGNNRTHFWAAESRWKWMADYTQQKKLWPRAFCQHCRGGRSQSPSENLRVRSGVESRTIEGLSANSSSGPAPPTCLCLCAKWQAAGIYPHAKNYSKRLSLAQLNTFSEKQLRLP